MSREWNGKLLDNNHAGDALATIVIEYVAIPCALITTAGALWFVYSSGLGSPFYVLALIGGPIGGYFVATFVGLGAVALIVLLAIVTLPFTTGYDRYKTMRGGRP